MSVFLFTLHLLDYFTVEKTSDLTANLYEEHRSWSSGNSVLDALNSACMCVCVCIDQHLQGEPYQWDIHPLPGRPRYWSV